MMRRCLGLAGEECHRLTDKGRCPDHARALERKRGRRNKGAYDAAWRKLRERAIGEHPWCSGCGTPGGPDNPLTGDHIVPRVAGGRNVTSNVAVLCRRCNSSKGPHPSLLTHP